MMTNEETAAALNEMRHLEVSDWIPTIRGLYSKSLYDRAQVGSRLAYPTARMIVSLLALAQEVIRLDDEDAGLMANDGVDIVNLVNQARAAVAKVEAKL